MTTSVGKSSVWRSLLRLVLLFLLLSALILPFVMFGRGMAKDDIVTLMGPTMGTRYSVKYLSVFGRPKLQDIEPRIVERLAVINRQMSTYDSKSELSRFNKYEGDNWFAVSSETAKVVAYALLVAEESDGAFDPTVGPAVNLWGFGPDGRRAKSPSEKQIAAALLRIGSRHVAVQLDPPALLKKVPDVYLDLSAVAKGYAVDAITELLIEQGIESSMVEIGGEVRTQGKKPGDVHWKIGIEQPDEAGRSVRKVLNLEDKALATSGDYRNYFEEQGVRYSHTIDPTTGRPVQHLLATVSVVADTCMEADALATALLVMGEEKGYDWCEDHDVAALFLIRTKDDNIEERASPAFTRLRAENEKVKP